jgi:hypothetical protein
VWAQVTLVRRPFLCCAKWSGGWLRFQPTGRTPPQSRSIAFTTSSPVIEDELGRRGALSNGLTWHFNRPPVVNLEYEMDCRRIHRERVVEAP